MATYQQDACCHRTCTTYSIACPARNYAISNDANSHTWSHYLTCCITNIIEYSSMTWMEHLTSSTKSKDLLKVAP
eukprot:4057728-Ditylum_brightwellii.AAC.2